MKRLLLFFLSILLLSCGQVKVPDNYEQSQSEASIYPDYKEVTIPVNMAPLNFELITPASDAVIRFSTDGYELVCGGLKARPDIEEWKELTAKACGKNISVEIFTENEDRWTRFKPFTIYVSSDSIDQWLSYRLISPSFVSYEELTLNQRCLENFEEKVFVDNMLCSTENGGQCVNCHSFQQYNPERMQFHARETHGGTVIVYDGKIEKIDMKHEALISSGVYPAWHPWMKLIAYSTNKTMQSFHTAHPNKVEVLDSESDLILYDLDRHAITTIEQKPDELEIFPAWSPDGKWLYFCSTHFEYQSDNVSLEEITMRYRELKYNIYRKSFNPETRTFGEREMVFCADTLGMSATMPRISPDGRWLLFTMGEWGCFHIWHHDADLWLMDLGDKQNTNNNGDCFRPLNEINSDNVESYHSWSSNGRWIVFSSRRYDGMFTRLFFAHISPDGTATKPFELPCADPDYNRQFMKSYNVPEFMHGPIILTPQEFASVLKEEGIQTKLD